MRFPFLLTMLGLSLCSGNGFADIGSVIEDFVKQRQDSTSTSESPSTSPPGAEQINRAVLDALALGVQRAIELLEREGGYLDEPSVPIPMPKHLREVEKLARKFGQDKYADRFIRSMNKAAERAVPETAIVLADAIKNLNVDDARAIVTGESNAATEYFRRASGEQLREVIKPLVISAMEEARVTRYYKKFIKKTEFLSAYVDREALDLDNYVTDKALEGLFLKLVEEEAKIRRDPLARGTGILKSVFGYFYQALTIRLPMLPGVRKREPNTAEDMI